MIEAPLPENEEERIQELLSFEIMNSESEKQFDEIVSLASTICNVPISLLSFVDYSKQFFKAKIGMEEEQTDRSISFCSHTILNNDMLIVEDATEDERFHDNPLVKGGPKAKFYAGMPLTTSKGYNIGSLCVLDTEKRVLTDEQKTALNLLARQVIKELELRKTNLEYKRTISKLQSTEELLLEAEDLAKIGSWEYVVKTGEFSCTDSVHRLLGVDACDELSDFSSLTNFLKKSDRDSLEKLWQNAVGEGEQFDHLASLEREGQEQWISFRSKPIFEEEHLVKVIGSLQDVTTSQEIENKLIIDKRKAEEATAAKSEFLAIMSHEIRTPLNAIIGLNYLLLQEDDITEEHKETLKAIRFSSQNLLSLINDILDFSKIESGKIEIEKINFRLKDLLKNIKQSIGVKASEKNIDLTLTIENDVPDEVAGDPVKLTQIITNLVGNAIKFTDKGSVGIHVDVLYHANSEWVIEFKIKDSGIGIPKEKQEMIFERFMQANASTHRSYGGTGLGLAITKKLIDLQGGKIEVDSEVGKGSTFTVIIKYSSAIIEENEPSPELTTKGKGMLGSRILVVDDNLMNQKVAEKLLKSWQANVGFAENGFLALEKLRTQNYDLVLMDLHMPVMDGIKAIQEIRTSRMEVPIIAFTANSSDEERDYILKIGGNDYISKPFAPQELYNKIVNNLYN